MEHNQIPALSAFLTSTKLVKGIPADGLDPEWQPVQLDSMMDLMRPLYEKMVLSQLGVPYRTVSTS
jgi:hypothetical protein